MERNPYNTHMHPYALIDMWIDMRRVNDRYNGWDNSIAYTTHITSSTTVVSNYNVTAPHLVPVVWHHHIFYAPTTTQTLLYLSSDVMQSIERKMHEPKERAETCSSFFSSCGVFILLSFIFCLSPCFYTHFLFCSNYIWCVSFVFNMSRHQRVQYYDCFILLIRIHP